MRGGERVHLDGTLVPVLDEGQTSTGRLWNVVRDDRPICGGGPAGRSLLLLARPSGRHPEAWLGTYAGSRRQTPSCASGGSALRPDGQAQSSRRPARRMAVASSSRWCTLKNAPMAVEAVSRIAAIFAVAREIKASGPARQAVRGALSPARQASAHVVAADPDQALGQGAGRQCDRLHPEALAGHHPLPRRGPPLPVQQQPPSAPSASSVGRRSGTFAGSDPADVVSPPCTF